MLTSSGGIAVMLADALEPRGFSFPPLTPETTARIGRLLPRYATVANPLDITAGLPEETFGEVMSALIADPGLDLLVVENPATSTPGLAFLLATIARYGEDAWQEYWRRLRENGVLVVDGWEEAYTVRFSGASGSKGSRPIVVSYASSPPAEVIFRTPRPSEAPTAVVEDSCFRQIEFAGILRGARNEDGARALVDFMLSRRFQEDVPLSMFVFPVNREAKLPREFETYAVVPESPLDLPPEQIEANRDRWVKEWTDIVVR